VPDRIGQKLVDGDDEIIETVTRQARRGGAGRDGMPQHGYRAVVEGLGEQKFGADESTVGDV
jgi:hypothetical protein